MRSHLSIRALVCWAGLVFASAASAQTSFDIMPSGDYSFDPVQLGLPTDMYASTYSFSRTGWAGVGVADTLNLAITSHGVDGGTGLPYTFTEVLYYGYQSLFPLLHPNVALPTTVRATAGYWHWLTQIGSFDFVVVVGHTPGCPLTAYGPAVPSGYVVIHPMIYTEDTATTGFAYTAPLAVGVLDDSLVSTYIPGFDPTVSSLAPGTILRTPPQGGVVTGSLPTTTTETVPTGSISTTSSSTSTSTVTAEPAPTQPTMMSSLLSTSSPSISVDTTTNATTDAGTVNSTPTVAPPAPLSPEEERRLARLAELLNAPILRAGGWDDEARFIKMQENLELAGAWETYRWVVLPEAFQAAINLIGVGGAPSSLAGRAEPDLFSRAESVNGAALMPEVHEWNANQEFRSLIQENPALKPYASSQTSTPLEMVSQLEAVYRLRGFTEGTAKMAAMEVVMRMDWIPDSSVKPILTPNEPPSPQTLSHEPITPRPKLRSVDDIVASQVRDGLSEEAARKAAEFPTVIKLSRDEDLAERAKWLMLATADRIGVSREDIVFGPLPGMYRTPRQLVELGITPEVATTDPETGIIYIDPLVFAQYKHGDGYKHASEVVLHEVGHKNFGGSDDEHTNHALFNATIISAMHNYLQDNISELRFDTALNNNKHPLR